MQTFNYMSGLHDVWALPTSACDFSANGAKLLSPTTQSTYQAKLDKPGNYYFGCSINGHCQAGMLLRVSVGNVSTGGLIPQRQQQQDSVSSTPGSCSAPVVDKSTGLTSVSCRSPGVKLAPGDNKFPSVLLPNPYPTDGAPVVLYTLSGEVTDASGRSVPLSEVYLHHVFGDYRFIPGEGAEARKSPMRVPLPGSLGYVVNGSYFIPEKTRYINFHVINTVGVSNSTGELKKCIECWCKGTDPPTGSVGCCSKCVSSSTAPAQEYYYSFNVTYKPLTPGVEQVDAFALDIGGNVEYNIAPGGPGTTSTVSRSYPLDYFCPQKTPFSLARCWGHMHIGAQCVKMYDEATGEVICSSCAITGNETDVVGNEKGYVVGMSYTDITPPRVFQPGQRVKIDATYDSSQPYAGVMGVMNVILGNFTPDGCALDYSSFIQPPVTSTRANVTAQQLEDETNAAIAAIPKNCGTLPAYFENSLQPCLPLAVSRVVGGSMNMADMGVCCAALKANPLSSLYSAGAKLTSRQECFCPLGEVLRLALDNGVFTAMTGISQMCTGKEDANSLAQGIGVALNAFFAPTCPELRAKLAASSAGTGAAAPAPSTQSNNAGTNNGGVVPIQQQADNTTAQPVTSKGTIAHGMFVYNTVQILCIAFLMMTIL